METSSIVLLVISGIVSFGAGRVFVHFRDKKRENEKKQVLARVAQALRDQPPETGSRNKSKRKRQLQQLEQREKKSERQPR